jgi:dihydropteroate synthase
MAATREPSQQADLQFLFNTKRVWIMGVVNVTPDSFYAGGRSEDPVAALKRARACLQGLADVLDIGGESTRPGAAEVSTDEEVRRTAAVIDAIHAESPSAAISIDTRKSQVARQAFDHGASILNDISALRHDPAMADVAASYRVPVILMHMQGTPQTMQQNPRYTDVVADVKAFFEERLQFAVSRGIPEDRIVLDPGIGFGKTLEHNVTLLKRLPELAALGRPLLVGLSRKSFLGTLSAAGAEPLPAESRLEATLAANLWAVRQGAAGLRVHDVEATRRALRTWEHLDGRG